MLIFTVRQLSSIPDKQSKLEKIDMHKVLNRTILNTKNRYLDRDIEIKHDNPRERLLSEEIAW